MSTQQIEIKDLMNRLQTRGWTVAAIARELEIPRRTVQAWHLGLRQPQNAPSVRRDLERLLERKRIPKRKRYQPKVLEE